MNAAEDRIGAYALGEVLGEGGMAIVYRAEQSEPVMRTVAIKVLKPGMDSRQIVSRFESERQTLARLEHPNIAKVFDAGTTQQGRPYFVMELVRGVAITRFCDEQHLDIRSRVKLFLDVCMAVQHAHQKGMIHRDLKPSNILVEQIDGKPIVKIIDFGIAKAISADASEQTQLTRIGQLVGTPLYMSPEQAQPSGVDIDTRSDIYSLGVVLYELLAGALPLDLENIADYALAIALREQDPPTPSQRVAKLKPTLDDASQSRAHLLVKSLKGDLDWIAMKAIAKDRSLRYQTASELATDLDHYLHELPVLARAPTAGYLLNRFVRRNRIAVAAAAMAALALTIGAVVATVGFVQARTAERKAVAEAETARQVSSFLVDLFSVSDPGEARGNTITAREILDKAATRVTNELGSAPEVRATLMYTMANVYAKLGLFADASKLAVPAMDLRGASQRDSTEFADSLDQVGRIYRQVNRRSEAEPLHRMALSIRRSKAPIDHVAVAKSLQHVGMDLYAQTKYNEALRALLEARQEINLVANPLPEERGELTKDIADLYHDMGQFQLALQMYQEALQLFRTGLGVDHPQVASTLGEVAVTLKDMQRYPEAEQAYLEALAGQRKSLGPRHPMVAMTLNNIAVLYRETKKLDQALDHAHQAIAIDRATLGDEHNQTNVARITAARVQMDMGHYSIAEAEFRAILENRRRTLPPDNLDIGLTLGALATLLNIEQRYKESEPLAREARDITERAFGHTHWQFANMTGIFGATLAGQGRYSEAEPLLLDCYAVLRETRGDRHPRTLSALQRLSQFYTAWGKKERAGEMQALLEKIN